MATGPEPRSSRLADVPAFRPPRRFLRFRRSVRRDLDRLLEDLRRGARVKLHLGCGDKPIVGMVNCDLFSPHADLRVNSKDLGALRDASVDLIESHHMIEHLSFADAGAALGEWWRVLRPGGYLILTCPDLDKIARRWGREPWGPRKKRMLQMLYGSQEHEGMFHLSGYNREHMGELLGDRGFRVLFSFSSYPSRPTPSLLTIAVRSG